MIALRLDHPTDFEGWRRAARALLARGVKPSDVVWTGVQRDLLAEETELVAAAPQAAITVPKEFFTLARCVIQHRDAARLALLYDLLWRLQREKGLLSVSVDPLIARLHGMRKSVHRDQHKMKAFVRFREVQSEDGLRFVAWFEPEHHIVEATAPFFAARFATMRWSILTPDACAHWDDGSLMLSPGADISAAPDRDDIEEVWRTYYGAIFNPARLNVKMMRKEMPKKYWRNLPEAPLIKALTDGAAAQSLKMIDAAPVPKEAKPQRLVVKAPVEHGAYTGLEAVRHAAAQCRACPLWKDATQTVFGEGPQEARLVLVGEQPGDSEDLAGKPFVGPAGKLLDRALHDAGIVRSEVYVTNAVKHFKFEPRGKRRLHKRPTTTEIQACNGWLRRELEIVKPQLIVAMGATAAHGVFGRAMTIGDNRGRALAVGDGGQALITVHPSYLLRIPEQDKAREYAHFVADLKQAATLLQATAR